MYDAATLTEILDRLVQTPLSGRAPVMSTISSVLDMDRATLHKTDLAIRSIDRDRAMLGFTVHILSAILKRNFQEARKWLKVYHEYERNLPADEESL